MLAGLAWLGCAQSGTAPILPDDSPDAVAFLAAHNRARAAVAGSARAPVPPLVWSAELAASAARTAARCSSDHGSPEYGENLAGSSGDPSASEIVAKWLAERAHWNAVARRCTPGRECSHYTQIVWRDTRELGCARQRCEGGRTGAGGPWTLAVCHYAPSGNVEGEAPY